jgi:hypothetical protein
MKKKILVAITLIGIGGCASTAPSRLVTEVAPDQRRVLDFSKIEIDDYAQPKETRGNDGIYFTGWLPIPDKAVLPSFHEAFTAKLTSALNASGKGDVLQIAVIESGFYMDSQASDSVVFVGIAAAFRERPYKCTATLNFKVAGKSVRKDFDNVEVANRSYGDLEDKSGFISKCQDKLVSGVVNFLKSLP